ncbi:MAG: HEAT repeat domain-containing protein [Gemmataceae bacterium]
MRPLCLASFAMVAAFGTSHAQPTGTPVPTRDLVAALIDTLRDADVEVRTYAATALAAVGTDAVEPLVATLSDKNPAARAAAAYALGQMGAPAAPGTAALVKALKDEVADVRRQSAQAIGRILLAQKPPATSLFQPLPTPPDAAPPPAFPAPEKPRP